MSTTLNSLSKNWLEMSADYRPSAFWFWNSDMNPDRMREVVTEMAANGIREFLIHPVHGMTIEYLSDEFFDRYRYALELAKEHGLRVWVYDEFGWPTGNVGGLLLREHPEHKSWYLAYSHDAEGNVVAKPIQSDRVLDNTLGAPWTKSEAGYLDTMSHEAVRCFIEMTHERIYRECGELFHEVIAGFFTDEPVCMMDEANDRMGGWTSIGLPWTPVFPARFRERFGYDIEPLYTELAGDGPSQAKRDYWTLVKEIYVDAYHGQIARWCHEHSVKYTGHVGEDRALIQVRCSGSTYQCLAQMDIPGIDFLGHEGDVDQRFDHHVLVPSIARHAGKDRVYCEAYGISHMDIRLGEMLKRGQMLGIYGTNDVALMGFHQGFDGVRKQTYWPPIFTDAPWWPFYAEYRDAFARSVGLTSLGARKARYAIMYPQNQLEQTDLFIYDIWRGDDPASRMITDLALAVYAAGETFEFVFPEIIDQAQVENGKIVFPHAEYDAILAPSDIAFFEGTMAELSRVASAGGEVMSLPVDTCASTIRDRRPSWTERICIDSNGAPGDVRVHRFDYPDGELFVLRNATEEQRTVCMSSQTRMTEWDPTSGKLIVREGIERALEPHETLYITLTDQAVPNSSPEAAQSNVPVEAAWTVATERPNMARLSHVQFYDEASGWLDAVDSTVIHGMKTDRFYGLPAAFHGKTRIEMRGEFDCGSVPETLGMIFEPQHLESLTINGTPVDLAESAPMHVWDPKNRWASIQSLVREGRNEVGGVLRYEQFETSVTNHAFFMTWPMPTCDLCLAGSFRYIGGSVIDDDGRPVTLPARFDEAGWPEYDGILTLTASVAVSEETADRICGIEVDLHAEDSLELLIDGESIGRCIVRPYRFDLAGLTPGEHTFTLRISSTSGNILEVPSAWGACAVRAVISHQRGE